MKINSCVNRGETIILKFFFIFDLANTEMNRLSYGYIINHPCIENGF